MGLIYKNSACTMMAKPTKTLQLRHPMIQFLIMFFMNFFYASRNCFFFFFNLTIKSHDRSSSIDGELFSYDPQLLLNVLLGDRSDDNHHMKTMIPFSPVLTS